jgi:hypothetical protein
MYTQKDHLLGHLLAAALELMVGEKALIAFSGGCPYGFYADVFPPFPLGVGYLAPLKDHMENFIRKKDLKTYVMEKKNAEAFLAHRNKKRTLKKLQETSKETVVLLQIQESFFILDQECQRGVEKKLSPARAKKFRHLAPKRIFMESGRL